MNSKRSTAAMSQEILGQTLLERSSWLVWPAQSHRPLGCEDAAKGL